ncbi:sulfoacetaldehyde dehydrogenase [Acetoanaerobium pronyense]|uniref:Sulfoacetaldehyde dehydrogenase n=1 Tax=Acetoanaerobium pronyense TaxID=1482736 RepID=A0ABS4KGM3_9FIRM|nr:aldehyde dehydrogenase family protein [Acetoanaerobium pronyense]MBP2026505.1 sulfoacetaldehyde dehydrogenase [Acetoanaerobium pronyense]
MSRMNSMEEIYKKLDQDQINEIEEKFAKADAAQKIFELWSQEDVDRAIRAIAWKVANKRTFRELVEMSIEESKLGDPVSRENKRFKIRGVLRDALRQKSVGIIEEIPEKGIVKYAKPVGVIACVVPATNPDLTPAGNSIYALKARNAIIFSPHPRAVKTGGRTIELMREGLREVGAPEDLIQILGQGKAKVNKALSEALNSKCDLVIATGGQGVVRRAYSSGTPAYGVGAGNSTMVWDETAKDELAQAAINTMLSKTSDYGSGCSADGNIIIQESIFEDAVSALEAAGGYLLSEKEQEAVKKVMWDKDCHRLSDSVAQSPQKMAELAGFSIPEDRKFLVARGTGSYTESYEDVWCREKLTTLLAVHKYKGEFKNAIEIVKAIHEVGGKGHSVGIYSYNEENIHALALNAQVGRIMVRQPQSKANAGAFTNGMPMTSSIGCGTWGGNATSENVNLKHYMNITWVSKEIPEDRPSDEELFGEFYNEELEKDI